MRPSCGGGHIGEDSSPPPYKLVKERRSSSRRMPQPNRETHGVSAAHSHQLCGLNQEGRNRLKLVQSNKIY